MAVSKIAFIMYPVTDLPRAVKFYHEALGLAKGDLDLEYWVEFEIAGGTFGIGNFEQIGKPGTAQSLALEISDLPAFRAKLKEHGVESTEPHELPKCFISTVHDPDGNTIFLHTLKPSADA